MSKIADGVYEAMVQSWAVVANRFAPDDLQIAVVFAIHGRGSVTKYLGLADRILDGQHKSDAEYAIEFLRRCGFHGDDLASLGTTPVPVGVISIELVTKISKNNREYQMLRLASEAAPQSADLSKQQHVVGRLNQLLKRTTVQSAVKPSARRDDDRGEFDVF